MQGTPAELLNFVQAKRMKAREGLSMLTIPQAGTSVAICQSLFCKMI